jgi:hypothetical protein
LQQTALIRSSRATARNTPKQPRRSGFCLSVSFLILQSSSFTQKQGCELQEYNAKYVPELFIDIAHAMGFLEVGQDKDKAVKTVLQAIRDMNRKLGIPKNIKDWARPGG